MDFRELVLSLPETFEKEAWGHPTFRVRKKMFAIAATDLSTATVKSTLDEQRALTQMEPETFSVPGYVGKYGWIRIEVDRVDPDELRELTIEAWRMTAPKRLVKSWDDEHPVEPV
jgi:hypothetical protein